MSTSASTTTKACVVCDQPWSWQWTDTHGIAQCYHCGAPYRIFHYEGDKRVEKDPECVVLPHWIPLLKRYRAETKRVIPGGHSFPGGQELARREDFDAFNSWCDKNRAEIDAAKAAA